MAGRAVAGRGTVCRAPARRFVAQTEGHVNATARVVARSLAVAAAVVAAGLWSVAAPAVRAQAPSAATLAATGGASTEAFGLHAVHPGETFWQIAARYGMTVADVAALNGLRPTALLLPGRSVRVPVERAANARAASPAGPAGSGEAARTLQADVGGASGGDGDAASATPYEVVLGDTLYAIADRFDADIEAIKRRNGLPEDGSIYEGQTLQIPSPRPASAQPVDADGDGKPDPAADTDAGARAGSGAAVRTTDTVTVASGETLSSIAARYGTTAAALMRLNALGDDNIYEGQSLQVPHAGSGVLAGVGAKRIEVDVSDQRMFVWEGDNLAFNWTASTGLATHPTRTGSFAVQSKEPNAWSSAWELWMPHWLGIYWAGGSENGIHALPILNGTTLWGGLLGSPVSYGCVVLDTANAEALFNWVDIGTPVEIHD